MTYGPADPCPICGRDLAKPGVHECPQAVLRRIDDENESTEISDTQLPDDPPCLDDALRIGFDMLNGKQP